MPLVLPIPTFLFEVSLPPLRVTPTHLALSFYERALHHPTSFPISGLARLIMKPRLSRSSWRDFASTHPLVLPPTSPREVLLACPFSPHWNLPFFTVEFTLSSPCSRSHSLLSRQSVGLAHLDSLPPHNVVISTDGSAPFPFDKGGLGVLANCFLCGTEATLSFSAGPLCSCLSAEACAILQALCWSRQHQQVCYFSSLLLSDSRSVLATLSSLPSFPLPQSLWQVWQELSSLSSFTMRLQWVPGHSFSPRTTRLIELARRGALLVPSAIPCSVFSHLLYTLVVFFRTVSSKFCDTDFLDLH